MKKIWISILCIFICFAGFCLCAGAASSYLSHEDARYFLAFVYNADVDHVTEEALADDIFYKMLIGAYSNDPTYELAAQAAFLSHMDTRVSHTLEKANVAVKSSSDYLIEYFSKNTDEDATGLVTDIYKENVANSIWKMCDGELVGELLGTVADVAENPQKYLDDVKAITAAFAYTYGQNVTSLYTYFDAAISCGYLKSTPGAYETAMAYNITALKDSNFMSFAAKLIPGITSWEEWVGKMDLWADYVYHMRGRVSAGGSSDFHVVVYFPNCEELDSKILWYTGGQLFAPQMERERYILTGWYLDEACTIGPIKNDYVPNEKVVFLYAKWEPRYFRICFDSNCQDVEDYIYELDRLNVNWIEPTLSRKGYIFNGWYWDAACNNPVEGDFQVNGNMTFYADWICMYSYTVNGGKAQIWDVRHWKTDENGNRIYDLEIPETVGGYSVDDVSFEYCSRVITGISLPDSMTTIKRSTFAWYTSLEWVDIGDGIQTIEDGSFARCAKLHSVTFGKNVKTIGREAFTDLPLLTEIVLPEGLTTIGSYAFSGCGISELVLPDSVTSVGDNAFGNCDHLKTVSIGVGVKDMLGTAFSDSALLENIFVSEENPYFVSVDGVLYNKDKTILYLYPPTKKATNFVVPETVQHIAPYAFVGCQNLSSINLSNVKKIEKRAFENCTGLESVDLSGVDVLEDYAFYRCKGLKNVLLSQTVEALGNYLFYECENLENITIPSSVKSIGYDCFSGCAKITELIIPESVTFIDSYAFYGMIALKSIKLPSSLGEISSGLFGRCESLESIELPQNITTIGYGAFSNCRKLKTIEIPETVCDIWGEAFSYCTSLDKITIPEGVTTIGYMSFYNCQSLRKIVIPKSVTYIEYDNFGTTPLLSEIYYMGTKQEWDSVEIYEIENDYLLSANVICSPSLIADIENIKVEDAQIKGEVQYSRLTENTEVLVALYEGDTFVRMVSLSAKAGDDKTEFSLASEKDKKYQIKAFFWDFSNLIPNGINQTVQIQ